MELVVPTAEGLDLEVPGEVRQPDSEQFLPQGHQSLAGHCGQEKAMSQPGLPACLPSKPFSGSRLL